MKDQNKQYQCASTRGQCSGICRTANLFRDRKQLKICPSAFLKDQKPENISKIVDRLSKKGKKHAG